MLIPLGVDQDPHFRLTRDVAPKIGRHKPALMHNVMMPALEGPGGKMSASSETGTIYTIDTPAQVRKKIGEYAFSGRAAGQRAAPQTGRRPGRGRVIPVSEDVL